MPMGDPPAPADPMAEVVQQQPAPPPKPPLDKAKARQDLFVTGIIFAVALIVIGVIFAFFKVWARRRVEDCENPAMTLTSFREMYENGELSDEEYERVRNKMAAKMKGSLGIKPLPAVKPKPDPDVGQNGTPPQSESPG
jgi:hypothetical protein